MFKDNNNNKIEGEIARFSSVLPAQFNDFSLIFNFCHFPRRFFFFLLVIFIYIYIYIY